MNRAVLQTPRAWVETLPNLQKRSFPQEKESPTNPG